MEILCTRYWRSAYLDILRTNALKIYFGLGEDRLALRTGGGGGAGVEVGGEGEGEVYRMVLPKCSIENPNTHHS